MHVVPFAAQYEPLLADRGRDDAWAPAEEASELIFACPPVRPRRVKVASGNTWHQSQSVKQNRYSANRTLQWTPAGRCKSGFGSFSCTPIVPLAASSTESTTTTVAR